MDYTEKKTPFILQSLYLLFNELSDVMDDAAPLKERWVFYTLICGHALS